eukprot:766328-Hanusia_phi.AAC.1
MTLLPVPSARPRHVWRTVSASWRRRCSGAWPAPQLRPAQGIPVVHHESIRWGKQLGKGAFGTVRLGSCVLLGQVENAAIKSISARGSEFNERLRSFKAEAVCTPQIPPTSLPPLPPLLSSPLLSPPLLLHLLTHRLSDLLVLLFLNPPSPALLSSTHLVVIIVCVLILTYCACS